MSTFSDLYSGKRFVLGVALMSHDPFDQFAWCQGWRFAIADFLTFEYDECVPGFVPGISGPDREAYEFQELMYNSPDVESLKYAFDILSRFREFLALAGEDY